MVGVVRTRERDGWLALTWRIAAPLVIELGASRGIKSGLFAREIQLLLSSFKKLISVSKSPSLTFHQSITRFTYNYSRCKSLLQKLEIMIFSVKSVIAALFAARFVIKRKNSTST